MKKIVAVIVVMLCFMPDGFTQPLDSTNMKRIDTLNMRMDTLGRTVDTIGLELRAIMFDSTKNCKCKPFSNSKNLECTDKWLIFSPLLLFIFVFVPIIFYVNGKGFDFKEALTENDPPKKTIKNPEYNAGVIAASSNIPNLSILFPPTIEVSNIASTVIELKEIALTKEAGVLTVEAALKIAEAEKPNKVAEAAKAETELKLLVDGRTALDAAVTTAAEAVKSAKETEQPDVAVITAAEEALKTAETAVAENETARIAAQATVDAAKKAVLDNASNIERFTALLPKLKFEADAANKIAALAEKDTATTTTYSPNTYRPSISRYIAFITSLVIIILVVCMSSFFMYHYMRTGCPPDFGALTVMLIALGLGVTPYITNKISTAAVNKS